MRLRPRASNAARKRILFSGNARPGWHWQALRLGSGICVCPLVRQKPYRCHPSLLLLLLLLLVNQLTVPWLLLLVLLLVGGERAIDDHRIIAGHFDRERFQALGR